MSVLELKTTFTFCIFLVHFPPDKLLTITMRLITCISRLNSSKVSSYVLSVTKVSEYKTCKTWNANRTTTFTIYMKFYISEGRNHGFVILKIIIMIMYKESLCLEVSVKTYVHCPYSIFIVQCSLKNYMCSDFIKWICGIL